MEGWGDASDDSLEHVSSAASWRALGSGSRGGTREAQRRRLSEADPHGKMSAQLVVIEGCRGRRGDSLA